MTGNKQASDVSGGANATEGKITRGRGGGVGVSVLPYEALQGLPALKFPDKMPLTRTLVSGIIRDLIFPLFCNGKECTSLHVGGHA